MISKQQQQFKSEERAELLFYLKQKIKHQHDGVDVLIMPLAIHQMIAVLEECVVSP